ncbi:hypothetical protein [Aquisalimonas sp.]|uniref:hypothetical protein n=1 Tax=unclassified Aquisalimonas TaxID=2644645 RepID=UPI0025BA3700|nr:hypothetical protein [Aquisalimonas sp.]
MNVRYLIATMAVASLWVAPLAADTTQDRLIKMGFLPPPINASTLVESRPLEARNASEQRAIDWGFMPSRTEVVRTYVLTRQAPETGLTATETELRKLGFVPEKLSYRSTETDGTPQPPPDRMATRDTQ